MLENKRNQLSRFKTKNWVKINDSYGVYNTGSQIRFKTSMLRSNLCNYSDEYILAKRTIMVPNTAGAGGDPDNRNKKVTFENCAPFSDCLSEINNTNIYLAKDIDVVTPIYNLIEYSENYLKTYGGLWKHFRDKPPVNNNGVTIDFPDNADSASFKFEQKITGQTGNDGK